jgi:hypothetical protein
MLHPLELTHPAPRYEDPLDLIEEIEALKRQHDAVILAHFYVDGEIQEIADHTGDSLKLARDAVAVPQQTIVFAGVHFMAESAKILSPQKRVLLPDLQAGCSLADSCPPDKLAAFQAQLRAEGRDFQTVAYINTTAAVKSLCDWIADHPARVPGGDRSQHDSPAAETRSAAHLPACAGDHGVGRQNVRLQQVPAHGAQHAAKSAGLSQAGPARDCLATLFRAGPVGAAEQPVEVAESSGRRGSPIHGAGRSSRLEDQSG